MITENDLHIIRSRHATVKEEFDSDSSHNRQTRLIYQHKIELGVNKIKHYGLTLAANTNLPQETVNLARELAELIDKNRQTPQVETPQRSDEALLYKLNADIKLESRKHSDADDHISKIIQKFKQEHPQLISRLLIEKSESTKSANTEKSSPANHLRQETSNNDLSVTNFMEAVPEKSPSRHFPKVATNTKQSSTPSSVANTVSNSEDTVEDNNNKFTSVTFSNELLNTFTNIERLSHERERQSIDSNNNIDNNIYKAHVTNDNEHVTQNESEYERETGTDYNNSVHLHSDASSISSPDKLDITNDEDANISLESLDMANELTQVIGSDDAATESKSNSIDMSIDEELMTETVNEISEELMLASIEQLILAPPVEFQD